MQRIPLTSLQLELLLAFEMAKGLVDLSRLIAKDPSVTAENRTWLAENSLPVDGRLGGLAFQLATFVVG